MRDREMDRAHAAGARQTFCPTEQLDDGFAAALVPDADAAPRNRMPEGLARRLLGGEETGESLRQVELAQGVRRFPLGIDFAREPRELALVETITHYARHVEADSNDHRDDFDGSDAGHLDFCRES